MAASEPSAEELAGWVTDGCQRAMELVADLSDEQLVGPLLPTVNPLLWEIGHLAWFQEKFVLRQACGEPPIRVDGDALYDSGAIPHDTRWRLVLPSRVDTLGYMRSVADRVAEHVLRLHATDVVHHFARYTVHHYDTHTEALTYTRQSLGYPPPSLPGLTDSARRTARAPGRCPATSSSPADGSLSAPGWPTRSSTTTRSGPIRLSSGRSAWPGRR